MGKSKPIVVKEEDYMKRLLVHNMMVTIKRKIRYTNLSFGFCYFVTIVIYLIIQNPIVIGIIVLLITLHLYWLYEYRKLYERQKYFLDNNKYPE